jgi:hypothetical protein
MISGSVVFRNDLLLGGAAIYHTNSVVFKIKKEGNFNR